MMPSLNILLAEDDPLSAMALEAQLNAIGHRVVAVAPNGREAVRLAAEHPADVVILDVRMPIMSGVEAAQEITRARAVPVIFLTGVTDTALYEAASRLPLGHVLVKPVPMDDLGPAIETVWNRWQSRP